MNSRIPPAFAQQYLLAWLLTFALFAPPAAHTASSCDIAIRLDAVMVSSNITKVGFPSLLDDFQNPVIFFRKKLEAGVSLNTKCYVCHEHGTRMTSDTWEYDPITGAGPTNTAWSGLVKYLAQTNGVASFDCTSTRTGPDTWSDPACGFGTPYPSDI